MAEPGKRYYVITHGTYSDYTIDAVTDDEGKAVMLRNLIQMHWTGEDARIEEHTEPDIETIRKKTTCDYWDVTLDGSGEFVGSMYHEDGIDLQREASFLNDNGTFVKNIRAIEEHQAIKIARDIRAEMLAQKYGY